MPGKNKGETMATKTKRASDTTRANGSMAARSRGGDGRNANGTYSAAPNTKPGASSSATATSCAEQAAGGPISETETRSASRKSKSRSDEQLPLSRMLNGSAGDVGGNETEPSLVSCKSNGHAKSPVTTSVGLHSPGGGDSGSANDSNCASRQKQNGRSVEDSQPKDQVSGQAAGGDKIRDNDSCPATCRELQELQRRKVATLKSRIMIDNQLAAIVSLELGYHAGLEEADRKRLRAEAVKLIEAIDAGDDFTPDMQVVSDRVSGIVSNTRIARNGFDAYLSGIEKEMVKLAKALPAAKWCLGVRGFGLLSLATIIGETGDLSLYSNPAKVWKRLGLAPIQGGKNNEVHMPSTWRKSGGLSAEEWTAAGYSPRRRSILFNVGECLVKLNDGDYRQRYVEAKVKAFASHPEWDWKPCDKCAAGQLDGATCKTCGGTGQKCGHAHNHGMLLAVKRLVRDLWRSWRDA